MRLNFKKRSSDKLKSRLKKKIRIRKKIFGTENRPRLSIFRSAKHFYAQIVDDSTGKTLVEASTLSLENVKANKEGCKFIGQELAKRAKEKKITTVVFDRSGYLYHGKVKALAEAVREAGLSF